MYLKRYIHGGGQFKVAVVDATLIGQKVFSERKPSPIDLQLLTQAMTGAALLTASLKNEGSLQFTWRGDGPMGRLVVDANTAGDVRGMNARTAIFDRNPSQGLLSQAIGSGSLTVRRRSEPGSALFESIVTLEDAEIALSLARYLLESEQIHAGIQLGAKLHPELGVAGAGGILIEALPGADENLLFILEDRLSTMQPLGEMFASGKGYDLVYDHLLEGMDVKLLLETGVRYHCDCSRQRTLQAIASLGRQELEEMLQEQKTVMVDCGFCNKSYPCTVEDLAVMLELASQAKTEVPT